MSNPAESERGPIKSHDMTCHGLVGTGSGWSGAGFQPWWGFVHLHMSQAVTYSWVSFFSVGQYQYFRIAVCVLPIPGCTAVQEKWWSSRIFRVRVRGTQILSATWRSPLGSISDPGGEASVFWASWISSRRDTVLAGRKCSSGSRVV